MPKAKSVALDPTLIALATEQTNALKATLEKIAETTVRSTKGLKPLNKNGRPLAKVARNAAATYPEVLAGRFDKEEFDIQYSFDEQTEPLISLINDTADTFTKIRNGNSADIEYFKRKVYAALSAASLEDSKYSYYAEQLATEYEGQGKRSSKGDENNKYGDKPSGDK
jgi:hypothetical protein